MRAQLIRVMSVFWMVFFAIGEAPTSAQSGSVLWRGQSNRVIETQTHCAVESYLSGSDYYNRRRYGLPALIYTKDRRLFLAPSLYQSAPNRTRQAHWNTRFPTYLEATPLNRGGRPIRFKAENVPFRERPSGVPRQGYAAEIPAYYLNTLISAQAFVLDRDVAEMKRQFPRNQDRTQPQFRFHISSARTNIAPIYQHLSACVRRLTPPEPVSTPDRALGDDRLMPITKNLGLRMSMFYPERARRDGRTGRVSYRVAITPLGRVSSCEVTQSSGHADLDQAACRGAQRHLRFPPASAGDQSERSWTGSITFR